MPIKSPPKEQADRPQIPEKLKLKLYPSVLDLFASHDFHRVNIREISRRSGVSTGTIYKYFISKETLIFKILDEHIDQISCRVQRHIAGMQDIKEIFRKVFWVTMDVYDANPGVAVTAFITVPMRTWMQDTSYRRKDDLSILKQHIRAARDKKTIDPSLSSKQIMDAYYMVCYRYIHNWYYEKMSYRLTDRLEEYFNLFWKILKP